MSNNSFSWMAAVADDTKLSQLTLPGTHDTAALHGGIPECQNRPLLQQLQIGIRLLDLRLRYVKANKGGENFALHHGDFYQWAYFDGESDYSNNSGCQEFVLQDCISFLQDNPTECIVMSISQTKSDLSGSAFNELFRKIIKKNKRDTYFYLDSAVPKLGDVRGKIVVVNRIQPGLGVFWGRWDKQLLWQDSGSRNLDVEDHYMEAIMSHKWDYVKAHLDKAWRVPEANATWFLTYTSCAGLKPRDYAKYINPRLSRDFTLAASGRHSGRRYGSIFMDFPSPYLVSQITQIAQFAFPTTTPKTVSTATTPWLYDKYDGKISVAHDYGQNNRVTLSPTDSISKLEVRYQGGYGIVNLRVFGSNGEVLEPSKPFSNPKYGSNWVSQGFGGSSIEASGDIDGIQFGYQGGYGIVNARVHLRGKGDTWENWLTNVKPSSFDFVTDAFTTVGGIHWIGTWRQDRYGIVDAQCCYTI